MPRVIDFRRDIRHMTRPGNGKRLFKRIGFWTLLALCAWGWFGITPADETSVRNFNASAERWQVGPEFRTVTMEYCNDSARALLARPFGLSPSTVVLAARSVPGLPKRLAVNPTSQLHYQRFSKGALCAYLHLCGELDVAMFAKSLEDVTAGQVDEPSQGKQFLESFHMDEPVVIDAGAIASAVSLSHDIDHRPLTIRENIAPLLQPHIGAVARSLGAPENVDDMSPLQQRMVLDRLDSAVRHADPELWRTKQLSDFCGGVWAQVFGPDYALVITPILMLHQLAGILLAGMVLWMVAKRRRRHGSTEVAVGNASGVPA
jgi:hypothetical protein